MAKRSSRTLQFFCFPPELEALLVPVLTRFGLKVCAAEKSDGRYHFREVDPFSGETTRLPHHYLFDPIFANAGLDSCANLIQVSFPKFFNEGLCMSEIGMLVTESELNQGMVKVEHDAYRVLRNSLAKAFTGGVWGRNSQTGGEHFYRDIRISKKAEDAARNGLVLRTIDGHGFVTFSPESV